MKIVIGSDKSGFHLKEAVKNYLNEVGVEYIEVGTKDFESPVPFFKTAPEAIPYIISGEVEKAILICGTGMGMSQVANKYRGIRAACCESTYTAKMCRAINDSNVLCLGGWIIGMEMGLEMVKLFLNTAFTQDLEPWRQEFLQGAKKEFDVLEAKIYG